MNILVVGAGTIGVTYAWLLSGCHEITLYVRPERLEEARQGFTLSIDDERDKTQKRLSFTPRITTSIGAAYDMVLVTVNRLQLVGVLPLLAGTQATVVFMLNHWDIGAAVAGSLPRGQVLYGFPSAVGGGRRGVHIAATVFPAGTVLGKTDDTGEPSFALVKNAFTQAGLAVEEQPDILGWLKVHYLQQSITAGALAKAGSYEAFAGSYKAVKEMVYAFREGIAVCAAQGVDTKKLFPATLFRYPAPLVCMAMRRMFQKPQTTTMVTRHMAQGWPEWVAGYREVLCDGRALGVYMPV